MTEQITHNKNKSLLKTFGKKVLVFLVGSSLPEIMLLASLVMSRYLLNADFSYPREIILPILLFGALASLVYYIYKSIFGNAFSAHISALLLSYSLYMYSFLPHWVVSGARLLLPRSQETSFSISLVIASVLAIIAGVIGWRTYMLVQSYELLHNLQPYKVLLFTVSFVFSLQVARVGLRIGTMYNELSYKTPQPMLQRKPDAVIKKPDIYYFVFDRYASSPTLKNIYNYDNTPLTNYLAGQGFVTNNSAYANYPFTMESITSTLAMQYHTDLGKQFGHDHMQSAFPYRTIFNDPPVAQVLKQNGYTYNQVSSWWDFTRINIKADSNPTESFRLQIFGKSYFLSDLVRDIINKSILSPWLKKGLTSGESAILKYDLDNNPKENFFKQLNTVKAIADQPKSTPQFTFAHVLAPHDPYIFDADGSDPTYNGSRNDIGLDEIEKYTREITYLNTQIKDTMSYIRQHSPNAIIIIQSDEGPYPKEFRFALSPKHYYDPINLALPQMKQKYGVLASYYMPGVDQKTVSNELNSSVNAFRFVLNHYLGYSLDMLPACQFSTGDKFVIYDYTSITKTLTGTESPLCQSYR